MELCIFGELVRVVQKNCTNGEGIHTLASTEGAFEVMKQVGSEQTANASLTA